MLFLSSQVIGASKAFDNSIAQASLLGWAAILMDNTLPKIIHQMWIGPPLPLHIYQMMQSWKEHHPTWEVKLWTEAPPLVNQELWDNAEKI